MPNFKYLIFFTVVEFIKSENTRENSEKTYWDLDELFSVTYWLDFYFDYHFIGKLL